MTVRSRASVRLALAAAAVAGLLCGCEANITTVTGGADPTTKPAVQSETAAAKAVFNGAVRLSVAYNDETGQANLIQYPDSASRKVVTGATAMGWSWSDDLGKTWTHGGPLQPPPGFTVLWGDPAMTVSGSKPSVVFLSSLAVPSAKMPAGGIMNSFSAGAFGSPIGGACIAKSIDGGKTFTHKQCVQDLTPNNNDPDAAKGHFYDGGAMASTPTGEVFAAYDDIPSGQMDVWRAPNENAMFAQAPDPFPGKTAVSHPRMRVGPDGVLYLAAKILTSNSEAAVFMTRLVGGKWTPAVQVGQPFVANIIPTVDFGTTVQGSKLTYRMGPQFAFDVGKSSKGGKDAVRLVETHQTGGRFFLKGFACAADLTDCAEMGGWQIGPSSAGATPLDVYNPDVVAWPGDAAHPDPAWQTTFMERFGASITTVNVSRTTLGFVNGSPLVFPVNIAKQIPLCPDTRGFWGDYDVMIITGPGKSGMNWMRFFADSSNGCTKRWTFTGQEQHVSQANYDF